MTGQVLELFRTNSVFQPRPFGAEWLRVRDRLFTGR